MAVIRTFISHHGEDYSTRVAPILRQVAKLGVRPWLDKIDLGDRVGLPLEEQLNEAILHGDCSSVSLFLSKASIKRKWVEKELMIALTHLDPKFRILPVLLDPRDSLELPETFLRFLDGDRKVIWLEPDKSGFAERYARSVYHAGGLDQDAKEVTLCLGHRDPAWVSAVPTCFADKLALDIRLHVQGSRDFSPTEEEWDEIEQGFDSIRHNLPQLERINICGSTPLGVGHIVGKVWDRRHAQGACGLRSYNATTKTVWMTYSQDYELKTGGYDPRTAQYVRLQSAIPPGLTDPLLFFVPHSKVVGYRRDLDAWNEDNGRRTVLTALLADPITSEEQAEQILWECVGLVRYLREKLTHRTPIHIATAYALSLAPLFAFHLRTLGPIHFYDEVKQDHSYRLATVIK
jgi:hypothetical protein